MENERSEQDMRGRLIQAALDCFLADEYHQVTTRQIARNAGANVSMIHYYFGSKQGLYEEMIAETLRPMLSALDSPMLATVTGFGDYLKLYYDTMAKQPAFPKLILKVLALNHGPGRRFIQQLLTRGRAQGARKINDLKNSGQIGAEIDPDVLRMSFVSLAMTPMLLKDIFEEQIGQPMDQDFLNALADFNGRLLSAGLTRPTDNEGNGE